MSTLLLGAVDTVIGGVASTASSLASRAVSGLFSGGGSAGRNTIRHTEGPRLTEMNGVSSQEGAPIPRLYGRARLGGQLIWATRFEEVVNTSVTVERQAARRGGKGMGRSGASTSTTVSTTYSYFGNLAVGLCQGPIAFVRRVWADGREVDLSTVTMRVHRGGEDQAADPLIVAKEGLGNAPAYRGLAYVVLERLPLAPYGNRVPQLSFEVVRPVGALGPAIRSVCLIPGATEFGYDPRPVTRVLGLGRSAPENVHQLGPGTDVGASLDALQALCPNLQHVSLVVSWFGSDLRAAQCQIRPKVDLAGKDTSGAEWSVSGLPRSAVPETSRTPDGAAAYGGTPSDESVVLLIRALKERGLAVTLYPFVMMDVPAGNLVPDPWTGGLGQPAYPWRGRVTCDPAPGRPGTADGTGVAATQVAAFFGTAAPGQFGFSGDTVTYAGPDEWSFRRLALHYARIAKAAGGVHGFVVGSELIGLTRVRSASGVYPAVSALRALATDLRAMLGAATKLVYAADWTEYGAHVLGGGSEVRFPLDPLFADPAIDAVGIDYYPPVSDWRDGSNHADAALARSGHDLDYLRDRLGAGEVFDWFYASAADRDAQARTPITDGAYGKPWIFRAKDLVGWWGQPHVERVGGVEIGATAWVPGSKPIWLTEIGIPAVDKGPNGPNVFPDAKSSESALPFFSSGQRDDLVQDRALRAILSRFDPALPGHPTGANPPASLYSGRMVDPSRVSVWCWDARPFPAFPDFGFVWADGANWSGGHWITGRLEGAPLDRVVAAILADHGLDPSGTDELDGFLDGYVIDRPMSCRDAIEPLATLFGFDAAAGQAGLRWRGRGGAVDASIARDDLVETGNDEPLVTRTRAQETDLPAAIELGFTDADGDYARAVAGSRRLAGTSRREAAFDVALVTRRAEAQRLADIRLQDVWSARDTAEITLSPRAVGLEPGDVVHLATGPEPRLFRVERIVDGEARRVSLQCVEPACFTAPVPVTPTPSRRQPPSTVGPPCPVILDLPAAGEQPAVLQHLAVAADPWPGAVAVYRSPVAEGPFTLHRLVTVPAIVGRTVSSFGPGPVWHRDDGSVLDAEFSAGAGLASVDEAALLAGADLLAVLGPDGEAEIVSGQTATLVGPDRIRLTGLLRGLGGTEHLAGRTLVPGATLVRLDGAVVPLVSSLAELGQAWFYRIGPASRDPFDPAFVARAATVGPTALLPFAPVSVQARRAPEGVWLSWIRRTRFDGDGWELAEVPLNEDAEAYAVEILSGGAPVRTLGSAEPACLYPQADELADFGAPQSFLTLRVFQVSALVGRGRPAAVTLAIS